MINYLAIYQLYPQVVTISDDVAYDEQGNIVVYDPVVVQEQADKNTCKQQAQELLASTDWTTIADVADPEYNPYLMNQREFKQYRSVLRNLAVNPVANPIFPTQPIEQWSS